MLLKRFYSTLVALFVQVDTPGKTPAEDGACARDDSMAQQGLAQAQSEGQRQGSAHPSYRKQQRQATR